MNSTTSSGNTTGAIRKQKQSAKKPPNQNSLQKAEESVRLDIAYSRYLQSEALKQLIEAKAASSRVSQDNQLHNFYEMLNDLKKKVGAKRAEYEHLSCQKQLAEHAQTLREITEKAREVIDEADLKNVLRKLTEVMSDVADLTPIEGVQAMTGHDHVEVRTALDGLQPILEKCSANLDVSSMIGLERALDGLKKSTEGLKEAFKKTDALSETVGMASLKAASNSLEFVNER